MARTRAEIIAELKTNFVANEDLIAQYDLVPGQTFDEQFSTASLEMQWLETIATSFFDHEQLVDANAANSRPQNLPNYRQMVLNYLDGLPLIFSNGQFVFNTAGVTDLETRNIIKRCAVLENNRGIVVKIAGENAGVLEPVTTVQAERILNYINQQTQPGVAVRLVNDVADNLKVTLTVYVDPNVIDLTTGRQLNVTGTVEPVKDAINSYLANLEFNGGFVRNYFSNTIEAATGVKVVTIDLLQWKYASLPFSDLGIYKIPNAGHFAIAPADLTINYLSDAVLG